MAQNNLETHFTMKFPSAHYDRIAYPKAKDIGRDIPDLSAFDSSDYDTEAMRIDARNGNFSPDNAEDYRQENIVRASLVNGQFSQARRQCASYGLNYEVERLKMDNRIPAHA